MFIPRIVGKEENSLNEAQESPGLTDEELAKIMELLGGGFIDDPIPEIPHPPRPRPAAVYTCPDCSADPPAKTTTTCDLCWDHDLPCHHNRQDGYVCIACASDKGLCHHCGRPKPARRQSKR